MIINRNKFFKKIFMFYLCILIIPSIAFMAVLYKQLLADKVQKATAEYRRQSAYIAYDFTDKLKQMYSLAEKLIHTKWLIKARSQSDILFSYFDYAKEQEIKNDILLCESILTSTDRIGIYIPDRSIIITHLGFQTEDAFRYSFNPIIKNNDEYANFVSILRKSKNKINIYNIANLDFSLVQANDLLVVCPLDVVSNARAIMFCYISNQNIANFFQKNDLSGLASIYIKCNNEQVCQITYPENLKNSNYYSFCINNHVLSLALDFEFRFLNPITLIPRSTFVMLYLSMFFMLIIEIILAYTLAVWTYKPINKLRQKLINSKQTVIDDDLKLIEYNYCKIVEENFQLQKRVDEYKNITRNHFLIGLLHGFFGPKETLETIADKVKIKEDMCYQVVIFNTTDGLGAVYHAHIENYFRKNNIKYPLVQISPDSLAVILISVTGDYKLRQNGLIEILKTYLLKFRLKSPDILCGTIEYGIVGISTSYQNALKKNFVGNITDIKNMYFYPTDWEIQLINQLKLGNEELSMAILMKIREENKNRKLIEQNYIKLFKIINETLQRVAFEMDLDTGIISLEDIGQNFIKYDEEQWEHIFNNVKTICNISRQINDQETERIGEQLIQYVRENYADSQMSLAKIGEVFGISQSGISKIFKKTASIKFSDFLCRLRMEDAKQLLSNDKKNSKIINVVELARRVGYDNDITFRRVFKRYVGMTPTEYSRMLNTRNRQCRKNF
jgi:AraC-like DNA-binding protein